MPDEEILKKRAKLDESFIAATNPELSGNKKTNNRRSSVSTPNLPGTGNVPTPVREKWKDNLEAKGNSNEILSKIHIFPHLLLLSTINRLLVKQIQS